MSEEETKQLLKSLIDHVDTVGRWLSIVVALLIVVVFQTKTTTT